MIDMLPQVYLARHGETAWSLSAQATGRTDIRLPTEASEMRKSSLSNYRA
jgi:probable phosphoglycerate mutase